MNVVDLLWGAFGLALAISICVLVHELAHLCAARLLRLPVRQVCIGFGPTFWTKTWRGIEVSVGVIPLGGFVAFDDADPRWQDAAIARAVMYAAGPLASLLLAVFLLATTLAFSKAEQGLLGALVGALAMLGQLVNLVAAGIVGIASDLNGFCVLAGPVDAVTIGAEVLSGGPVLYVGMVGMLSAGIALFNLLPISVLDGGQVVRAVLEAVTGLRLSGLLLRVWTTVGVTVLFVIAGLAVLGDLICSQSTQL